MKKWLKSSLSSLLIIMMIFLVLGFGYIGLIAGPQRAYEREDRYALEAMMQARGYKQAQILNRFSYDDVYYIARVNHKNEKFIVWFTHDLSKIVKSDDVSNTPMKPILKSLGLDEKSLNLGVYNNELVYVVKDKNFEAFYKVDSLEKVFEFGGNV